MAMPLLAQAFATGLARVSAHAANLSPGVTMSQCLAPSPLVACPLDGVDLEPPHLALARRSHHIAKQEFLPQPPMLQSGGGSGVRLSMNEAPDDYRTSHLHKGDCYDDELSANAWIAYTAEHELNILREVIEKFFHGRAKRCMDFACGTGRVTAVLQDLAEECIGIDISASMLDIAKKKCKSATFSLCDLTKDNPVLGAFDLITAFRFFGNAQDELRLSALSALHRYLEPHGYLVLNNHRNPKAVQNRLSSWTGGESGMDLSPAKLKRHAQACGFLPVDMYGIGCWSLRHRWQSWVEGPSKAVDFLERLSRHRVFATFAPDWVMILKKSKDMEQ
jgi:SAM-dependent methyltransferase